MQFRQKIETVILPLVRELQEELARLRTIDILNRYQFQINFAGPNKDKLPDGFWAKGRYVWALALARGFVEVPAADPNATFVQIDDLVEKIYDTYSFGAVYDPGNFPGSEKEFLTRLGLGIRVREPEALGFPEQFRTWAMVRLQPFNDRYFVPTFGLTFEEISGWLHSLSDDLEKKLNNLVEGLRPIAEDMEAIREQLASGTISLKAARERSQATQTTGETGRE